MPLLEDTSIELRARAAAAALGVTMPSFEEVCGQPLEDADDPTRSFALFAAPRLTAGAKRR